MLITSLVGTDTDLFTDVFSANDDQELIIPSGGSSPILSVLTKNGQPAEVWDLHVGATLQVLGRTMTLLKADGETSAWIERHSK